MRDYDDEILFLEDYGESDDEVSIWTIQVSFADGTKLTAQAESRMPPAEELTPREVEFYDPITGQKVIESDAGQTEAWELEAQTTAYRLLDELRTLLAQLPERPKEECPECDGLMSCSTCFGDGCQVCDHTGDCQTCQGRGWVFTKQDGLEG